MVDELTLEELVEKSGLSIRTVRFYIQEGLLPGPDTHGKNARYGQRHLDRLELIQRFKNLYLPLQQIRHLLNNMTSDEIEVLLKSQNRIQEYLPISINELKLNYSSPAPKSSALDYIRTLEKEQSNIQEISSTSKVHKQPPSAVRKPLGSKEQASPKGVPEAWQRIILQDGIELHYRIPSTSQESIKIDRLIAYARSLFQQK